MKRSLLLMACVGLCALALAACGKEEDFSAGKRMNAEETRALRDKMLAEQKKPEPEQTPAEEEAAELPDVCYYTEKGGKWHASADCRYLKNSTDVLEGSVESAALAGKNQPCSACAAAYIED
jgi:hypothetical protein